jgi:hypothetical protein
MLVYHDLWNDAVVVCRFEQPYYDFQKWDQLKEKTVSKHL